MSFNENTRVKIPAILHLGKLGYDYLSLSIIKPDETTNIFTELFTQSLLRLNPELENSDIKKTFHRSNAPRWNAAVDAPASSPFINFN